MLGTLVEFGIAATAEARATQAIVDGAWALLQDIQAQLSAFDPDSDLARPQRTCAGTRYPVRPHTAKVLDAAVRWARDSGGCFDLAQGSGPWQWDGVALWREHEATRLDAGGLAKGYAIDALCTYLQAAGCTRGWVNAGGDLRTFGGVLLPLVLRDEQHGGTRAWGWIEDGAVVSSYFAPRARSRLALAAGNTLFHPHVSVAAPDAMTADALTKILAQSEKWPSTLLLRHQAKAWAHAPSAEGLQTRA